MKLLYDITDQSYMVLNIIKGGYFLFKVENFRPPMLSKVLEYAWINTDERNLIIKDMEEFAVKEFEKLNDGF